MKPSTYLLLALLLVLGAIVLFLLPSSEERESSDASPVLAIAIDSASVAKVEIQRGTRQLSLENVGGKWMVTSGASYPADPAAVGQLLSGLRRLKIGSHISSNPERQSIFQVDSNGTKLVVTERSGKSTGLIIGKMGPSFSEVYLRQPASKDVYLAEGIEPWSLNKEVKDWRDRTVLSLPAEAISGLKYVVGGKEVDFRRDSTSWTSGGQPVETSVLNPPLTALAGLRADSFIDSALRVQTNPLTVSVEGPQNVALNFFPSLPDSAVYYVQASNSSQWFVVNKATAGKIFAPTAHPSVKATAAAEEKKAPPSSSAATVTPKKAAPPEKKAAVTPAARSPLERKTQPQPAVRGDQSLRSAPLGTRATGTAKPGAPPSTPPVKSSPLAPPAQQKAAPSAGAGGNAEDEGELSVHTVATGETMQSIARKYNVSVEQIMKWNLLKTIVVRPGQELYIFQKK